MYGIYLKQDPTVGNSRVVYNPKDEKRTGRRKQNEQEQCRRAFMDPLLLHDAGEIRYWQDRDFM